MERLARRAGCGILVGYRRVMVVAIAAPAFLNFRFLATEPDGPTLTPTIGANNTLVPEIRKNERNRPMALCNLTALRLLMMKQPNELFGNYARSA